jgi:hypothetical protein
LKRGAIVLSELVTRKELLIKAAIYSISTGEVTMLER